MPSTTPSSLSQSANSGWEQPSEKKSNVVCLPKISTNLHQRSSKSSSHQGTIIGVTLGSILFLIILIFLLLYFLRKHRLQKSQHIRPISIAPSFVEASSKFDRPPTLTPFRLAALTADATVPHTGSGSAAFQPEPFVLGTLSRRTDRHRPEPLDLNLTEKGVGWNATVTLAPPTPPPKAKEAQIAADGLGAGTKPHQPLPIIITATATSSPPPRPRPPQPTSTAKRSTSASTHAIGGAPPQINVATSNNVLIEAMYHLQERLANLENWVDPVAGPSDGNGDGWMEDLERQAPPTYVA
jgi:hypothetical protein